MTLLCDSGERYLDTYYDLTWVKENIGDIQPYLAQLEVIQAKGCVEQLVAAQLTLNVQTGL